MSRSSWSPVLRCTGSGGCPPKSRSWPLLGARQCLNLGRRFRLQREWSNQLCRCNTGRNNALGRRHPRFLNCIWIARWQLKSPTNWCGCEHQRCRPCSVNCSAKGIGSCPCCRFPSLGNTIRQNELHRRSLHGNHHRAPCKKRACRGPNACPPWTRHQ